jgi:elongation factor Ts
MKRKKKTSKVFTTTMASIDKVKKLRNQTGVSIMDCKKALEDAGGDMEKATQILKKLGKDFAKNRIERETKEGLIDSYIHQGGKIGVMVELNCESDFVARSDDFKELAHELCLQIAANTLEEVSLLEQPWIKDESKTIQELINDYIAKFGENITVKRFIRYQI